MTGSQLAAELVARVCSCGKIKGSGKSFCYSCWKSIPRSVQRHLYKRIGDGYEDDIPTVGDQDKPPVPDSLFDEEDEEAPDLEEDVPF